MIWDGVSDDDMGQYYIGSSSMEFNGIVIHTIMA